MSPRRCIFLFLIAIAAAQPAVAPAVAHDDAARSGSKFDADQALAYSGAAVGRLIGDHKLFDRRGRPASLADLRGRPLVISLIYTACAHTCPLVTQNLARIVEDARDAMGKDSFNVVSIGFDSRNDSPGRMRIFAREQGVAGTDGWYFMSGDKATIDALAHDLGFVFFRSPKGFDHITQTTLVDSKGRVYQHIYGTEFDAPRLVEPLKRLAIDGGREVPATISSWIDRVRVFCTVYDPAQDRYRFDYSIFMVIATGLISLTALGAFVIHGWRGSRSSARTGSRFPR
ncbi:MAG: SCO family protein [Alphaproteobacteria bacterium]